MNDISEGDEVLWKMFQMDGTKTFQAGVVERIDHSKITPIEAISFDRGSLKTDDSTDFHLLEDFAKRHEIKYMKS